MGGTPASWRKGDPRAAENARKAFHQKIVNRGRRNGKKRWATMTQEEKDYVNMKRDYALAHKSKRVKRINESLSKRTAFRVSGKMTEDELDDVENFFYGDII